LLLGSQ